MMILTMYINAYTIQVSIINQFFKMNPHESFKQLSDFEKGRIVQGIMDGKTQKDIAELLGKNQSSISRFLKQYDKTGDYQRVAGAGKKRKMSERDDNYVIQTIKRNRNITRDEIRRDFGFSNVSNSTISRAIKRSGKAMSVWQTKKPFISLKNIRKRVKFARAHLDWTPEQWREVLWSDESPFVFRYAARKRVWKIAGEYNHKSLFKGTVKHDKMIMVWGCFAYHGVGRLHWIKL